MLHSYFHTRMTAQSPVGDGADSFKYGMVQHYCKRLMVNYSIIMMMMISLWWPDDDVMKVDDVYDIYKYASSTFINIFVKLLFISSATDCGRTQGAAVCGCFCVCFCDSLSPLAKTNQSSSLVT